MGAGGRARSEVGVCTSTKAYVGDMCKEATVLLKVQRARKWPRRSEAVA